MGAKVTIEVDSKHESIVRRALALAEEMEQLALTAPTTRLNDHAADAVVK